MSTWLCRAAASAAVFTPALAFAESHDRAERSPSPHDASSLPFEPLGWFAVGVLFVALFVSIRWVVRRQLSSKSVSAELQKDDLLRDRRAIGQGIGAASVLFICFLCCLWGTHRVGNQVLKEVVNEEMTSIAVIGAHRLDLGGHEKLTDPDQLNGPEYLRVVSPLRSLLMATPHLKYIYTIRPTETGLRFVVDAADPIDSDDDGVIDQALLGEACTAQDPALVRAVETGLPAVSDSPYTDKWGTFISAFVPIKRADGTIECVVGVDADARVYVSRLHRMNRAALFGGVVAVVISVGFGVVVTLIQRRRRAAVAGLRESEERFRSIADTAPMMIWTSAADASLEYFNKPWLDFRGRTLAEEIGDGWVEGIHPDDREKMVDEYMGAFAARRTYDAEYRLKRYDGHYRWILDRGHPRFGVNGEFLGYVGACVDVTERKAAELAITRARDEAEEATRAKSEFLANMSHEIRTPMTAILGFADLLDDPAILSPESLRRSDDSSEQRELQERVTENRHEAIVTIKRHGQNLLAIINDILDISKIEAGKMTVETVLSSPTTVIADVLSMVRMPAEERGLEVRLVFETPIPKKIHTDPTRLRQILVNLMGNSVKFTSRGRVSLHVAFDGDDAWGPTMRFRVEDTGIGIAPEKLPLLFGAFQQADNSMTRRFGGTGLGLRISQRLAALLGGGIAVESKLGKGSAFTLSIATGPVHQVQMLDVEEAQALVGAANGVGTNKRLMAEAAAMAGSAPRVKRADGKGADRTKSGSNAEIGAQGPLAGARVLVVEDGPDNQRLIGFHLRKAGAKVEFADNGLQAVKLLTTDGTLKGALVTPRPYDLMLLDMQMPEMDGYTTARWIREREAKQEAAGHIPIIALTAHAMSDDRQRCLEAGCDEYSTKPIEKERVIALCAEAIAAQGSTASAA